MKILFVHEVNYLNKVLFEMHEFPELLSLRGHRVTFLHHPERDPSAASMPTRPSLRATEMTVRERAYPGGSVQLVTPPTLGGGAVERYVAPVTSVPTIRRLLRKGGFDVVVLYAVPTTGWQTVALARRYGVPTLFRAIDVSHSLRRTRVPRLIAAAESYVYRNADFVSANNPALAKYCVRHGADPARIRVDLPPLDLRHLQPEPPDANLQHRYGISSDDRVMLFMGTLYRFAGLETLIKSAAPAMRQDPRIRIVLVGDGEAAESIRQCTRALGLEGRVVMTGRVPYHALPSHIRLGHVAVNPFEKDLVTDCALPHKVLQYMASGIATVSTSLDGLRGVVGSGSGVLLVDGTDRVADAAVGLLRDDEGRQRRACEQRAFIEQAFDPDRIMSELEHAISAAIAGSRARQARTPATGT